ncbi:MAG: hypothetical protein H3C54_06850 [Taibaiella sp.]|nr:hypothetical protein [Taibaiella sp.]
MKIYNLILLILLIVSLSVRANNSQLSEKIDIPQTGWDKVLQMSNGNTFLFHFEARKPIVVKVFNPERKEINSHRFIGELVDVVALENSELHGIYEINGEAVIFISQAITNRNTLVALRFNGENGKLVKEHQLVASPSFQRKNDFSLVKNNVTGGYAVFCMKNLVVNPNETLNLLIFDEKHNLVRDIPVTVKTKDYDYTQHVSTTIGDDGSIVVLLDCKKIVHYPDDNDHYITVCYVAPGDSVFSNAMTKLPKQLGPLYGVYTYNEFSSKLNVFLVNATTVLRNHGLQTLREIVYTPFMLYYNKYNLGDMKYNPIQHARANKMLQEATDTMHHTEPVPMRVYTNGFGINTVISEENFMGVKFSNGNTVASCIGNIVVTKLGEDGREIWSEILPKRQFLLNTLSVDELQLRGQKTYMFRRRDPISDWLYQFASFYSFTTPKGDCYVIYNDMRSNFDHALTDAPYPMSSYTDNTHLTNASAICYKVTPRRESSKQYLLDGINTSILPGSVMVESGDYNIKNNTYASLFVVMENGENMLKLGWVKMDN